jgi:catechol-2,3-dioxygenase
MSTRFAVVTIWAEDVATNTHFYWDVLGLKPLSHLGSRPHFEVNGVYLAILKGTPTPAQNTDPDRFPLFALAVDDLDDMVRRLKKHGIALPWGIESDADGRWVMLHDPAGNLIELADFNS